MAVVEQGLNDEVHNLREFDKLKAVWVKKSRVNQLRVGGVISTSTAVRLREEGEHWIQRLSKNYATIQIDMEPTVFTGTVCLSLILCWLRKANTLAVHLEFLHVPSGLQDIIHLSGLQDTVRIITTQNRNRKVKSA